jgi:peptidoglycan/xylan/chitin deacetylase (PgdA/CDA1 family)
MSRRPPARTALPLIALTLLAGVALGWLLRDIAPLAGFWQTTPVAPTTASPATAVAELEKATSAPTDPPAPTATPKASDIPTATPTSAPASPTLTAMTEPPTPTATAPPTLTVTSEPPTVAPTAPPLPTPTAAPVAEQPIADYAGYVPVEGDTLETIAAIGGSAPDLIADYNLLDGPPQPGRPLIVPQLAGQTSALSNEPILIRRGRADLPRVALTLDAGAGAAPVPRMLEALRGRNITITFFLTGKWVAENPDLARQIVADGHEIANHTFTHPDLTRVDSATLRKEIDDTEALIRQTTGATSRPFFRPPYGAYDERVLRDTQRAGYLPIYWTLDSLDSVGEPKIPAFLLERITGKLTPEELRGAIILAHCGSDATADALPQILDRFTEMGLEVVKVSEVL